MESLFPTLTHTAPPLTVENVIKVLKRVRYWKNLGAWLRVPSFTLNVIESKHFTEEEQVTAVVKYWIEIDPTPSWSRLIWALDQAEPDTADGVRHYAEPPTGL